MTIVKAVHTCKASMNKYEQSFGFPGAAPVADPVFFPCVT